MTGQALKLLYLNKITVKTQVQLLTLTEFSGHKCPEKGRFFISSVAHSSPSLSDTCRQVHKSLILLGLTKIPFQNKQPPKGSDHPEASPTVSVRALSWVHRELLPSGPPGTSVVSGEWSQFWPWTQLCRGSVFFFFLSIYFMTTGTPRLSCHHMSPGNVTPTQTTT